MVTGVLVILVSMVTGVLVILVSMAITVKNRVLDLRQKALILSKKGIHCGKCLFSLILRVPT